MSVSIQNESSETEIDLLRGRYYEEMEVGQRYSGVSVTVTESMIMLGCALFQDVALLHRDHEVAAAAGFRGPIAPGVLTLGLCVAPIAMIIGKASATHLTDSIRYTGPVYAGDTLYTVFEITKTEKKSRFGLVEYTAIVTNQNDEKVAEIVTLMGHKYLQPQS